MMVDYRYDTLAQLRLLLGTTLLVEGHPELQELPGCADVQSTAMHTLLIGLALLPCGCRRNPDPDAKHTDWAVTDPSHYVTAAVALMNMVFAFGGQVCACGWCDVCAIV